MANRSRKKPPFVSYKLLKAVQRVRESDSKRLVVRTYSRSSSIYPDFVGFTIEVHNGKMFIPVVITENKVGHKLGEFSPTRKYTKKVFKENTPVTKK